MSGQSSHLVLPLPLFLCLTASLSAEPVKPAVLLSVKEARPAIERGLAYLEKDGLAWMKERKCVACHHGPFLLWSHNEARLRGFNLDQKKLIAWTTQALGLTLSKEKEALEKKNGAVEATNLLLGQVSLPADQKTAVELKRLSGLVLNARQKDGFWKYEGQGQKRPDAEANETTTLWAILALTFMEKSDPAYPQARDGALAWVKKQPLCAGNESLALRLVIEMKFGDAVRAKELTKTLIARQNADGSWNWSKDYPGDPYATGQSLYALGRAGLTADDPAVQRAWKFLLEKQRPDGSWFNPTKKPNAKDNPIAVYWGSAWATIGLLNTLPRPQ